MRYNFIPKSKDAVMFSEPQTITISGTANTLPRVAPGAGQAMLFALPDASVQLSGAHAVGKRYRRTARLQHNKIAADPLTASNTKYSMTAYLVVDAPLVGYTVAEQKAVVAGLTKWLTDTVNTVPGGNVDKLLGGEN